MTTTAAAPRIMPIGLDVGQAADQAAIVALACTHWEPGLPPAWQVTVCEAAPRGTPYRALAEHARATAQAAEARGWTPMLAVDATGIGRAVAELLAEDPPPGELVAVTAHGGQRLTGEWPTVGVPQATLGDTLSAAVERRTIHIPPHLPAAHQLAAQMVAYTETTTRTGRRRYQAARESDHDDLVAALALAVWSGTHWATVTAARMGITTH